MTLKEEFKDMMKLIAPNITADSIDEDYTIKENVVMALCDIDNNDVTDEIIACYECEHCNQGCCTHKHYQKVDIYLDSIEGLGVGYLFNRTLDNPLFEKKVICIKNREELIKAMSAIKQNLDSFRDSYADYAMRVHDYKKYAREFTEKVINDFPVFENIDSDAIPIVFSGDFSSDHDWENEKYTKGCFYHTGLQTIIKVYDSWNYNIEGIKQTIRHEIIHYLLWMYNPIGIEHLDECGVFQYFCNLYNAGAYAEMDDSNKELFNMLNTLNIEEVNRCLIERKLNNEKLVEQRIKDRKTVEGEN